MQMVSRGWPRGRAGGVTAVCLATEVNRHPCYIVQHAMFPGALTLTRALFVCAALALVALPAAAKESKKKDAPAAAAKVDANAIVAKAVDSDPWGLGGAEVKGRVIVSDKAGTTRELAYTARSRQHDPPLSKAIVRFSKPADMKGVGFLQIQKKDGDDDRYLYLPELARSRRIAGKMRSSAFMGTDFVYADLDRADLRYSSATLLGEEKLGKYDTWKIQVTPSRPDAIYAKLIVWVRQDNQLPLKTEYYNKAGVLLKTQTTLEVKRQDGRWYVTRTIMKSETESRQSELILEELIPRTDIDDGEFSVRNLEKN